MDPLKYEMLQEAAAVTKEQIDEFKRVSELLIKHGRVERLSEEAALKAIDRLAFEITQLSFETAVAFPNMTNEETLENEQVRARIDAMDDIMLTIAFGSGIHKAIVDVLIGERCDYHTQRFTEYISLMKR